MSQMQDPFPQQQRMSKSHKMLLQPQPFPQPHPPALAPSKKFIVCTSCFGFSNTFVCRFYKMCEFITD